MYQPWKIKQKIQREQLVWYPLADIIQFVYQFQNYILDPTYNANPGKRPTLPQSMTIFDVDQRFPRDGLFVPHNTRFNKFIHRLLTIWRNSYNRHQGLDDDDDESLLSPLNESEHEAYFICINDILRWIQSSKGIYNRAKFETYSGLTWQE